MNRPPSRPRASLPWLLWGAALVLALLASYVHLLTSAVERAASRHAAEPPGATPRAGPDTTAAAGPPIPDSHVALIVVP